MGFIYESRISTIIIYSDATTSTKNRTSITDLRREQETDYQVSLLHDEVKDLNTRLVSETLKLKRFQDEIDEQESLAKMAAQRMTAYCGDNPNLSKALADAQGKLTDLQQ